jgi:thioredoxin-like negative regulator of GroEL
MRQFRVFGQVGLFLVAGGLVACGLGCQADNKTAETTVSGPQIAWHTDIRAAGQEAQRLKMPLLLKFSASWCGPCQRMKAETFTDAAVVARVNACFVPVDVDADKHPELAEALEVEALPTVVILTHDLKVLDRVEGFRTAAKFRPTLAKVCDRQIPVQQAAGETPTRQ